MELNQLQTLVLLLVMVGMILGIGVLVLDSFSSAVRTETEIQDDAVNLSTDAATLSQEFCLEFVSATFANGTAVSTDSFAWSNKVTCAMTSNVPDNNVFYNVTYTYGADSSSQDATDDVVSSITPISSTWLPLIVTVAVLAIIMTLVIGSFAGKQR